MKKIKLFSVFIFTIILIGSVSPKASYANLINSNWTAETCLTFTSSAGNAVYIYVTRDSGYSAGIRYRTDWNYQQFLTVYSPAETVTVVGNDNLMASSHNYKVCRGGNVVRVWADTTQYVNYAYSGDPYPYIDVQSSGASGYSWVADPYFPEPTPTPTPTSTPTPTPIPPAIPPAGSGNCTYNIYPEITTGTHWYVVTIDSHNTASSIDQANIAFSDGTNYAEVVGSPITNSWDSIQNSTNPVVQVNGANAPAGSFDVQLNVTNAFNGLSIWTSDNTGTCTGEIDPATITHVVSSGSGGGTGGGWGGSGDGSNIFNNCGIAGLVCSALNNTVGWLVGNQDYETQLNTVRSQFYEKAPFSYIFKVFSFDTSGVNEELPPAGTPIVPVIDLHPMSWDFSFTVPETNGQPEKVVPLVFVANGWIKTVADLIKVAISVVLYAWIMVYFSNIGGRVIGRGG